jgi:hypothetical protein
VIFAYLKQFGLRFAVRLILCLFPSFILDKCELVNITLERVNWISEQLNVAYNVGIPISLLHINIHVCEMVARWLLVTLKI